AFGSDLLSGTYLMLNYVRPQIFGPVGVQAGATLLHLSNANIKAPNTSINSVTFNVGLTAALDDNIKTKEIEIFEKDINKKIRFGFIFRTGINQSDVVGTPQFPFYIFSAFAEKRLNPKSLIMIGSEYFNSKFLKEYIYYQSVAYPENNIDHDLDYKRIGVYVGHELLFGRFSVQTQLGYYVYSPFDFEGRVYNRIGMKHYLSSKWFVSATLKSHAAKAEALEFSFGIRL
ncbi:MAG: acyloxyacyl hydrolase, partial [Flavobacteriaceae bacterium]